jgi:hypothetical protein
MHKSRTTFVLATLLTVLAHITSAAEPAKDSKQPAAKDLFDGKTLEGWKSTAFGNEGKVFVKDGVIHMEKGESMTGITWTGKPPKSNYELSLEGMRVDGNDFFCTTTFPVGDAHCSLVVGGWGGTIVGLSSVDHFDASENNTGTSKEFKSNTWYRIKIRVTDDKIEAWIDDKQVVDQERKEHTFSIRSECNLSRPLGICTWYTAGAVRKIRLQELPVAKKP